MSWLASERLIDTTRRIIPTSAAMVLCALAAWSLYRVSQLVSLAGIHKALSDVPGSAILAALGCTLLAVVEFGRRLTPGGTA